MRSPAPPEYDQIAPFALVSTISTANGVAPQPLLRAKKLSFPNLRSLSGSRSTPNLRAHNITPPGASLPPSNIYALPTTLVPRTPTERGRTGFSSLFSPSKGRKKSLPPTPLVLPVSNHYPESITPTRPPRPPTLEGLALVTPTLRSAPPYHLDAAAPSPSPRGLRVHFEQVHSPPGTGMTYSPLPSYPTRSTSPHPTATRTPAQISLPPPLIAVRRPSNSITPPSSPTSTLSSSYHPPKPSPELMELQRSDSGYFHDLDFVSASNLWSNSTGEDGSDSEVVHLEREVVKIAPGDAVDVDRTPRPHELCTTSREKDFITNDELMALLSLSPSGSLSPSPSHGETRRDAVYIPSNSLSSPPDDDVQDQIDDNCSPYGEIPRSNSFNSSRFSSSTSRSAPSSDDAWNSYAHSRLSTSTSAGHPFHLQQTFASLPLPVLSPKLKRQSRIDPADPHALIASPSRAYASQPRSPGLQPLRILRPLSLPIPYTFPSSHCRRTKPSTSHQREGSLLPETETLRRRRSSASEVEGLRELVLDMGQTLPLNLKRTIGVQVDFPLRRLGTTISLVPSTSSSETEHTSRPAHATRRIAPPPLMISNISNNYPDYPSPPPTTDTIDQQFESALSSPIEIDDDLAGARVVSASLQISPQMRMSTRASLLPLSVGKRDSVTENDVWAKWLKGEEPIRWSTAKQIDAERISALEEEIARLKRTISVLMGMGTGADV